MKKTIILLALVFSATAALANRQVHIDKDGVVQNVGYVYGKNAKVDHSKNQYSDAEWASFGITEEEPYIIKDGPVWRDMTQAEKDALDDQLKQAALDKAVTKLDMDALFNALADLLNKPRADVEAAFKTGVDPKKAKKEKDK